MLSSSSFLLLSEKDAPVKLCLLFSNSEFELFEQLNYFELDFL